MISPTSDQIRAFVDLLPKTEYYIDAEAALDALQRRSQFNVIDFTTGWKVDLIVRKSRPFSVKEFERRSTVKFQGMELVIASAEDVLISKLEWAKLAESTRQVDDAAGILRIREEELDLQYVRSWVKQMQLEEQWKIACRIAGVHDG